MGNGTTHLSDLRLQENLIRETILSTGVKVPALMMSAAELLCADIILASILAEDLPAEADFEGSLRVLRSFEDPRLRLILPDLRNSLVALSMPPEGPRCEQFKFYFSEEGVMHQISSSMEPFKGLNRS